MLNRGAWGCMNWWKHLPALPAVEAALVQHTWFRWSITHHRHFQALNMQDRSSWALLDLIREEWSCMCITWGCMLGRKPSGPDEKITFVKLWEKSEPSVLRTTVISPEDQVSSNSSENLQTCEASLTPASPGWPLGAWEHLLEARLV